MTAFMAGAQADSQKGDPGLGLLLEAESLVKKQFLAMFCPACLARVT